MRAVDLSGEQLRHIVYIEIEVVFVLSEESYKELLRYRNGPLPVSEHGLSEREEYLLEQGFIEAASCSSYDDGASFYGVYDSSYKLTPLGEDALSEFEKVRDHEAEDKRQQKFQNQVSVAQVLVPAITFVFGLLVEHYSGIVGVLGRWIEYLVH